VWVDEHSPSPPEVFISLFLLFFLISSNPLLPFAINRLIIDYLLLLFAICIGVYYFLSSWFTSAPF
jgi:hypothetical protein